MNLPTPIRTSLRRKIFLRFTILVGIAIAATGTFSLLTVRSLVREQTIGALTSAAEAAGKGMEYAMETKKSITRTMAIDGELQRFAVGSTSIKDALRVHLLSMHDALPDVRMLLVLTPEGNVSVATDSRFEGRNLSFIPEIMQGANNTVLGTPEFLNAKQTYPIATPIRGESGVLQGILVAEFATEPLLRPLREGNSLGAHGGFLLFEREGSNPVCIDPKTIVLSSHGFMEDAIAGDTSNPGAIQPSALCMRIAENGEGIVTADDESGDAAIAIQYRLPGGTRIAATMNEWEIWEPVRLLLTMLSGMTGILLLLVTFIALRLSHDVVHPIHLLQKSLKELNTGHWDHTMTVMTGDELEMLDGEVGRLAERLKEAYSSLEKRVEERTQELKTAHAKDEALIESIGEGFLAIDLNGKILTVNRAVEDMLQWERTHLIGSHFGSVLPLKYKNGKPVSPGEHIIARALEEKMCIKVTPGETLQSERQDGKLFPIGITATPFLLGMEMQGVVVTLRDITEEKRIDRMKSEFISLASHQLRTPLTAIGWYIELLQGDPNAYSADQKEYLVQILGSHRRMVELVNSLLNVSRIDLGRVKIEPKETTIDELVKIPLQNVQPLIEKKKLRYEQRIPAMTITVDLDLVRMVIENLLSNAVKYTPDTGLVEVQVMADADELRFAVHDTGLGIPRTQQARIFEKLFRADNVVKTDTEGSGIGLYIAKSAVEAWGGRLWFESTEDRGSTFSFTVPRVMKKTGGEVGDVA